MHTCYVPIKVRSLRENTAANIAHYLSALSLHFNSSPVNTGRFVSTDVNRGGADVTGGGTDVTRTDVTRTDVTRGCITSQRMQLSNMPLQVRLVTKSL